MRGTTLGVSFLVLITTAPRALGQTTEPTLGVALVESWPARWRPLVEVWTARWSPLLPIADLSRPPMAAAPEPNLLAFGAPRPGILTTAGNPAALSTELDGQHVMFRGGHVDVWGIYRRPLDPTVLSTTFLQGAGLRRASAKSGVVGRFAVERHATEGTEADVFDPYRSTPLVPTDSAPPIRDESRVVMEGAVGRSVYGWRLGLAAGYEGGDSRSRRSPRGKLHRASQAGGTIGLARAVPFGMHAAVHVRATSGNQTLNLVPNPLLVRVYQLEGYSEVEPRDFLRSPYYRRGRSTGTAFGGALSGTLFGAPWAVHMEGRKRSEAQNSAQQEDPPMDRWRTTGSGLGGAVQRALFGRQVTLTISAGMERLDGDATRSDLTGVIYRSEESSLSSSAEVRYRTSDSAWMAAATFVFRRDERNVRDALAGLRSQVTAYMPGGSLELMRAFGERWRASASVSASQYAASSLYPRGEDLGPLYQRLIAPESGMYASPSQAGAFGAAVMRRSGPGSWLYFRAVRVRVMQARTESSNPFRPVGNRLSTNLSGGIVMQR